MGRIHLAIHAALLGIIIALVIHVKGFWFVEGLEQKLVACREIVSALNAEGDKAEAVATAIAKDEGNDHAENTAITRAAAGRFIDRNRVRTPVSGAPGGSLELSGDTELPSGVPELGPGSDPGEMPTPGNAAELVAVREEDVLVCTANFEYAWTAFSTFQQLKEAGLAVPVSRTLPEPTFGLESQPPQ